MMIFNKLEGKSLLVENERTNLEGKAGTQGPTNVFLVSALARLRGFRFYVHLGVQSCKPEYW